MKFVSQIKRTHLCGQLRSSHVGKTVVLMGWVHKRRDLGGLTFLDLRDGTGLTQVVFPAEKQNETTKEIRLEFVLAVQGKVRLRPEKNKQIPTGEIEVYVNEFEILNPSATPPFQIEDPQVTEVLRLKYRYLELRNSQLQENLRLRHTVLQTTRQHLSEKGFIEVETPILYKSTPEGARDYLVPSRLNPGHFYALPQSPQTLKQLLMMGGVDRYFQIARCFRDEDLRADRQPEFSQIDVEMSFVKQNEVMSSAEDLAHALWKKVKNIQLKKFPVLTYQESLNQFGTDKPDLRIPWKIKDITEDVKGSEFQVFNKVIEQKGAIKALIIPQIAHFSRSQWDKLTQEVKHKGAKGLAWIKCSEQGEISSSFSKFFSLDRLTDIFKKNGGQKGSTLLIVADSWETSCRSLGHLRTHLAHELKLKEVAHHKYSFVWVTDFPLFEFSPEENRWTAKHHPFTQVADEDRELLLSGDKKSFKNLRAKAYDLVCNGHEIAGGSIRNHENHLQQALFKALGLTKEEIKNRFGFFIEALTYGTPPHGGIAWGFDRIVMLLCETTAIRDVIAFPKTTSATCLMSQAPSQVDKKTLLELGLNLEN